jgi:methylamine dehydrogenase accessory protein MauD
MMTAMVVSQILLAVLVLGLAVAVMALARQIGVLHERIAPAGALSVNQRLRVGDVAPEMTLATLDGATLAVGGAPARGQLLFFLSPDCPVCKTLLPIIRSLEKAEHDWLDVVLASDGGEESVHRVFRTEHKLNDFPYVLSEALGRSFGVAKLPYAVLIDEAGKIASMGLVNSREHLESLFEAKDRGVASLQEYVEKRTRTNTEQQRIGA